VASFAANLNGNAAATRVTFLMGPFRPTFFLNFQGTLTININNAERRPFLMRPLGLARHSREDRSERFPKKKAMRLKKAVGPIVEARETKSLVKINDSESVSSDSDDKLSRGNNETSHAKVPKIQTILKEMIDP
jgi:hypothetical protein